MAPPTPRSISSEIAELTFQLLVHCQSKEASMASEFGLALSELRVLRLFGREALLRQRDLHDRSGMSGSRLTRIIDVLVAGGWVMREEDPEDRRGALLRLTASGSDLLEAVGRRSSELHAEILAAVSAERQEQIAGGLREMLESIIAWSAAKRRSNAVRIRISEELHA